VSREDGPGLDVARRRLAAHGLAKPSATDPARAVAHMGAVQAQDYAGSLWAVGLRTKGATVASVEESIERGRIVRTWPMRNTLHLVAAADVRWMVARFAPIALGRAATRERQLGVTPAVLAKAETVLRRALAGAGRLSRPEAYAMLDAAGIAPRGQRGIHILAHLCMAGLLCQAGRIGKQPAFALLEEWVTAKPTAPPSDAEALAQAARRYVVSHGPASANDFAWWTGIRRRDARAGVQAVAGGLVDEGGLWSAQRLRAAPPGQVHLLPAFDETHVGYKDRSAALERVPAPVRRPGIGLLSPTVAVDGQAVGTWRRTQTRAAVRVTVAWVAPVTADERDAAHAAVERYGKFLGEPVEADLPPPPPRPRPSKAL